MPKMGARINAADDVAKMIIAAAEDQEELQRVDRADGGRVTSVRTPWVVHKEKRPAR